MPRESVSHALGRAATPIFLLEDDDDDAYFVCRALFDAKIANPVVTCRTAHDARRLLESETPVRPVLFILDVLLGAYAETGLEFLQWLRAQSPPLGTTPAMVLSGTTHPDHGRIATQLGATSFIAKPVAPSALVMAVQALGFVVMTSALTGAPGSRVIERR